MQASFVASQGHYFVACFHISAMYGSLPAVSFAVCRYTLLQACVPELTLVGRLSPNMLLTVKISVLGVIVAIAACTCGPIQAW